MCDFYFHKMNNLFKLFVTIIFIILVNSVLTRLIVSIEVTGNLVLILKIIIKILLSILTIYLLKTNGEKLNFRINASIFISSIVIFCSFYYLQNSQIDIFCNMFFLISCFSVALFEELLFRKYTYYHINRNVKKKKVFNGILITSSIFALAHLVNLLRDYEVYSVINQLFFAFGIGVLLQFVYVKTNNLFYCITMHGLINYYGTFNSYFNEKVRIDSTYEFSDFISSLLFINIMNAIIIIPIYYYFRKNELL